MKGQATKQKVMDAASSLFYLKGYHGTSVRDIAKKANINVSLISYHFSNKQGLLEELMVTYFEKYLNELEYVFEQTNELNVLESLMNIIKNIIQYKHQHYQFTCFIHRELTLDNMLVREIMVTYLAKEKFLLQEKFQQYMKECNYNVQDQEYLFLQFKGLLQIPYLMPFEWKNQYTWDQSHQSFIEHYSKHIYQWLTSLAIVV